MSKYDASSIEVLTGLEPVKKRPGMYTDTQNPNHLVQEVVDNSVDEAMAGHADCISVRITKQGEIDVKDNGRGMPVDLHPKLQKSAIEVIMTTLHAGGKFSADNYQFSGGLHGVGVSVVNALSQTLTVEIKRDGKTHTLSFLDGIPQGELTETDKVPKKQTGTQIIFLPRADFFVTEKVDIKKLKRYLKAKAVLCPGLTISLEIESTEEQFKWLYTAGLNEYLIDFYQDDVLLPKQPFYMSSNLGHSVVEFAIAWGAETNRPLLQESYVNSIATDQGGTHVNGLRSGITEALKEFCEFQSLLTRNLKITPDDVWQKATFVIAIKLLDPQFVGQTKDKLSSREAVGLVSGAAKDSFSLWLNQHVEQGRLIAEQVINAARSRIKSSQKVVRKKAVNGPALPGKLTDCLSDDLSQTELFLVEGDSAGGSAKQARNKNTQAILPLRGKILNTWEVSSDQLFASNEIHDISVAIGLDPGSSNLKNLRYGKICILADADSDGLHIATLLCALFLRHFRPLVEHRHIFVAMPPLYRIDVGKETYYALDEAERQHTINKYAKDKKASVTRFKGLGEMNPKQLKESTMHPDSRRLVQLEISEDDNSLAIMDMLLAKKRSGDRKQWLESHGNLASL